MSENHTDRSGHIDHTDLADDTDRPSDGTKRLLRRARRQLLGIALARALLWALLGALLAVVAVLALDLIAGLSLDARTRLTPAPVLAALAILGWHIAGPLREIARSSDEALALWFEHRVPSLQYALVTQAGLPPASQRPALDAVIHAAPLAALITATWKRRLTRPAAAALVAALLVVLLPDGAVRRVVDPRLGDILDRAGAGTAAQLDSLATIVVRVTPPAYSGLAPSVLEDPSTVTALVGSRVTIEGRGSGNRWERTVTVPGQPEAVRLGGDARGRVLVLEPLLDSTPVVRLELPARDTVLRVATGSFPLRAALRDDLGLAEGSFELIVSAGGGELYTFRTLRAGVQRFDPGVRTGVLTAAVRLDTLGLKPGDLVHLRALALDRNDVTGPGRGASETRTLRIARADEYDSVSVDPVPPSEPEKDALSQRMILMETEALVARLPRLTRDGVVRESRRIAADQSKLRRKVGEIVFVRLEGEDAGEHAHYEGDGHDHADETPIVAINRPLLEAYNHMWEAVTALEIAEPAAAIPWMERAIAALQRARAAERIYLRGRPPRVVVDLARVRLAGKDEGRPEGRTPGAPLDPARAARLARFDAALQVVATDAAAAADSLLLIRVALPAEERGAALALDAAAAALRRGGDVTQPLAAARRALRTVPPRRAPLTPWGF